MIDQSLERAFKAAVQRHGHDLFAQLAQVEDEVAKRGLIYRNKSFPLMPKITVLSAAQRDQMSDVAERLSDLLEKVLQIFASDAATREYFMLEEKWLELALINPGYSRRVRISRFDAYPTDGPETFKVLENNTDCPAGVIFTGRVNQVLAKVPAFVAFLGALPPLNAEAIDRPDAFLEELFATFREFRGGAPLGVAVLQERGRASPEAEEIVKLLVARSVPALVCDPRDMSYTGGRLTCNGAAIDLVWNKINTADFVRLLERSESLEAYLQACRDRSVCHVNSFDARFVTESKLCAAYLRDPRFADRFTAAERELIARHVPWTHRLNGDPEVEFRGKRVPLRRMAEAQREDLVLKVAYDIRGDGVTVGRSVSQAEWELQLQRSWGRPYVLQEFIPPHQVDVPRLNAPMDYQPTNFSIDLFMFGGRFAGFGSKLSQKLKVNVFQGGSKHSLVSVDDPHSICGRLVRVFTRDQEQGNPAIVIRREGLPEGAHQELARRFDSVTVFVGPSALHDVQIRCFSQVAEIDFCGHGILAGAYAFARESGARKFNVETRASTVAVAIGTDGVIEFRTTEPLALRPAPIDPGAAMDLLGLDAADFAPEGSFCIASIGSPKLLLPVSRLDVLLGAKANLGAIAACSRKHDFNGVFAYSRETRDPSMDFHARAFNPRFGIDEDGATSVAAGALAAVFAKRMTAPASFRVEQGHVIGRRSEIRVCVDERGVAIGGHVTPVGKLRQSLEVSA